MQEKQASGKAAWQLNPEMPPTRLNDSHRSELSYKDNRRGKWQFLNDSRRSE
jgi:hypothetical protein